jgi:hypothetical protein
MNSPDDHAWRRYKEYLSSNEPEVIARAENNREKAHEEYQEFLHHAKLGECYVCKKSIKTFSPKSPCPHWLLRPSGVKKQHIHEILESRGYHRSAAYIRWFANFKALSRNINDLTEEADQAAVFHWSCRYEHIKWTFKCSQSDRTGHKGTKHGYPHFHFEMRLTGNPFVRFNDFHIPFTDEDLFWLRANEDPDIRFKQSFAPHGSGMQDAMNVDPEDLINQLQRGKDCSEDDAVFQIDSLVFREEGIPGELIENAVKASKESGKTIAFHLKELGLEPNIMITPSETIPDIEERTNPRKKPS